MSKTLVIIDLMDVVKLCITVLHITTFQVHNLQAFFFQNTLYNNYKGKEKVHPRTDQEGLDGE